MKEEYKILIPTDFSETADYALEIGSKLAQRNNAVTHILHIENIVKHWADLAEESQGNLYRDIREHIEVAKKNLNDRVELAKKHGVDSPESFLEFAKGYKGILAHIEEHDSDLVIMGAHGHTGLKGVLIGSFTQKVLSQARVPLLAMTETDQKNELKELVFVSDYDPDFADSIWPVADFAKQMDMKIHFLCVNTRLNFRETEETDVNMDTYVSKIPKELVGSVDVINANIFEDGLERYCGKKNIDVIAVPNLSKNHFAGVMGITIENLINRLDFPILAVPFR